MAAQLTSGGIHKLFNENVESPVFQVLTIKSIQSGNHDRFRMKLSDGAHYSACCMLGTQLNDVAENLAPNSIIRINRYVCNTIHETKKVAIILDLDVLHSGGGEIIGNPIQFETTVHQGANAGSNSVQQFSTKSSPNKFDQSRSSPFNRAPLGSLNANQGSSFAGGSSNVPVGVHPISSLTPYQNKWTICARVTNKSDIRTWNNSRGQGKLFSMDLLDESGEIRATAFNEQCDKFYNMIEIEKVYYITQAQLKTADKRYSSLKNDYEMTFNQGTQVTVCQQRTNIPNMQFQFVSIDQIENVERETTIDVIGICKEIADVSTITQKTTGKELKKRDIQIVDDSGKEDRGAELLARAIYTSGASLRLVEDPYWKEFIYFLRPYFKIPSHLQMSTVLLDREYEKISAEVAELVSGAESVAVMCDGWSNVRNGSIINFMVTTPSPVLYKTVVTERECHTAEYVANQIKSVIDEIGPAKVFGVVTDNAANMKAAWALLNEEYLTTNLFTYGCSAHGLNLLFTELTAIKSLQTFMAVAVSVVKTVKNSPRLNAAFRELQTQDNAQSLKLPVKSRRGSVVSCLESIASNKQTLQALAIDAGLENIFEKNHSEVKNKLLSDIFWDRISGYLQLLSPISLAIKKIESDRPMISEVLSIYDELEKHVKNNLDSSPFNYEEEQKVVEAFQKQKDFCITPIHEAADLLDPSKLGRNLNPEKQTNAIELIFNIAKKIPDVDEQCVLSDIANYRAKEGFFSKQFLWFAINHISPKAWWKGMCGSTSLAKVAFRILQLPATTARCEGSFSTNGNIHSKSRNRLKSAKARKIMFIAHNLKILSTEDVYYEMLHNLSRSSQPTPEKHALSISGIENIVETEDESGTSSSDEEIISLHDTD